jgi:signal transduction histidine kinase
MSTPAYDMPYRQQIAAVASTSYAFESLLTTLSTTLLNTPVREASRAIEVSLQRVVQAFAGDYGSMVECQAAADTPQVHYCWGRPGVVPPALATMPFPAVFSWYARLLQQGQVVCFSRPQELPAEAAVARQQCQRLGVQSFLALPLAVGGTVTYVLALATFRGAHPWPGSWIPRLRLVGELLVSALARQQADAAAHRLWHELAHAARVAMLGELTASMAHELNQPLAAILSNAQAARHLLAMPRPDLTEVRAALTDIIADDQRAGRIIQQLRGLGRNAPLERTRLDVNALVQQVVECVRHDAMARQVTIRLDLAAGLPVCYGDRVQLHQVLLNLVLNAFEAMRQLADRPRVLAVCTTAEATTLSVACQDNGVGADAAVLTHMFDAFFTTKAEGMGLGLAISRAIIEAHGGQIWARQNAGHGTSIGFTLPLQEGGTI